jgi:hypothetical protein
MTIHNLKCWPQFWDATERFEKTFEVRKNDRNFKIGDTIHLHEWNPDTKEYSGRIIVRQIKYIMRHGDIDAKEVPLHFDYVILGI